MFIRIRKIIILNNLIFKMINEIAANAIKYIHYILYVFYLKVYILVYIS